MDLGLAPQHEAALAEALSFIESATGVVGVVAAGTIIRGVPEKNSDLDIYVLHDAPWRQRIQRYFCGVPAEIFVNNFDHVRSYFIDEDRERRPITAHMLATGVVVRGADVARVGALVAEAKAWLEAPVTTEPDSLTLTRYMLACRVEDTLDLSPRDLPFANALLAGVIPEILRYACRQSGNRIPRDKDLGKVIEGIDPNLANRFDAYLAAANEATRFDRGIAVAEHVLGVLGFFEWESPKLL